jgi:hypothetical protein
LAKATLRCSQPWSPGRGTSARVPVWNATFCSIKGPPKAVGCTKRLNRKWPKNHPGWWF